MRNNVILGQNVSIGENCIIGTKGDVRDKSAPVFNVVIGNNVSIGDNVIIHAGTQNDTIIGDNTLILSGSYIAHDVQIESNVEISPKCVIGGFAKIKQGARLKLASVIRNRIIIGENSIIGMGAVVTKDVPNNETWVGVPAKKK